MTYTAFPESITTYTEGIAGSNPEVGPSPFIHGSGIVDARTPFGFLPGSGATTPFYLWNTVSTILLDQVPSTAAANNIATSQSPGAGVITLTAGTGVTSGVVIKNAVTGNNVTVFALDSAMAPVAYGQDATANAWNPATALSRCVVITSGSDDHLINFTVNGYDIYGYPMTQTLAGGASVAVTTTKAFKYIASVTHTGSVAGTVTVGTADIFGFPWQMPRQSYTSIWWGNPQDLLVGGSTSAQTTLEIPVTLANLANAQVYQVDAPFDGFLVAVNFRVTVAATTTSKAATLTGQANASSVTGGVVGLTSANCTPIGHEVAGSAITGANTFTAGQTVGVVVSSVTTFVEGAGIIELVVQNADATGGTFTAAVTTSPSTASLGDVRGTIATPSASDGTKRLTVTAHLNPSQLVSYSGATSIYGVTQV